MKLLLDANISRRIIPALTKVFDECAHVNGMGLSIPPAATATANIKASDLLAKKQFFAARKWEKSGQPPFKTMSIEELEAMIQ